MKRLSLIACLLCLAPVTKHEAQRLMALLKHPRKVRVVTMPPLPVASTNFLRRAAAAVLPAPKTNVLVSWTLSTNWLGGEESKFGTNWPAMRASLFLMLRTGVVGTTNLRTFGVVTNDMPYQASNSVTLPAAGTRFFRSFWKPLSQ